MAYQSDTNNREIDNAVIKTVLQGELPYDYSISIPELDYNKVEEELEGLEVDINEDFSQLRERVEILYHEKNQEEIYGLLDQPTTY